jgi:hypothetical protein
MMSNVATKTATDLTIDYSASGPATFSWQVEINR